jgi:hypothetical protein
MIDECHIFHVSKLKVLNDRNELDPIRRDLKRINFIEIFMNPDNFYDLKLTEDEPGIPESRTYRLSLALRRSKTPKVPFSYLLLTNKMIEMNEIKEEVPELRQTLLGRQKS